MHCASAVLSAVACPAIQYFITLSYKLKDFRKTFYWIYNFFLILYTTFGWDISHYKKKWARYDKKMYIGLHAKYRLFLSDINPLTSNDHCRGLTAPLTSKRCTLYIYSPNIGTGYFKHGIYSPFFFCLQNAVCFIILIYLVPVLFTFNIQGVLK